MRVGQGDGGATWRTSRQAIALGRPPPRPAGPAPLGSAGFPPASFGVPPPRPTRSRAASTPTGGDRRSGTRSPRPATPAATPARSRPTTAAAWPTTSHCWPSWACPPTASRSPGRGSSPTGGAPSAPGLDFYGRSSTSCSPMASSRSSPSTTGTCPRPSRTPAAGPSATRPVASPTTPTSSVGPSATGRHWTTVNEPWCAAMLGYAAGAHAGPPRPGRRRGRRAPPAAGARPRRRRPARHSAHRRPRSRRRQPWRRRRPAGDRHHAQPYPVVAAGDDEADHDAARRIDGIANRLWYDAVLRGRYPDDVLDDLTAVSDLAHIRDGDLAQISRPVDALGLNYYRRYHVRHEPGPRPRPRPGRARPTSPSPRPATALRRTAGRSSRPACTRRSPA